MKIVKISAIWCGACLIMNKVWNKLKDNYKFEAIELDLDMDEDEVKKYDVGNNIPVFIVYDGDKEITRVTGEFNEEEFIEKLEEVGVVLEKNN